MSDLIGAPVRRVEDGRLLRGRGGFLADLRLPGARQAVFIRSPYPHARIVGVDGSEALGMSGVEAVVSGRDLLPLVRPVVTALRLEGMAACGRHALAHDVARYVGDPVAVVVAADRYAAEDAAERVAVHYEPLPAVVGAAQAVEAGAPRVHQDIPDNLLLRMTQRSGEVDAAFARAALRVEETFTTGRVTAASLETRGCAAAYDAAAGTLAVWSSTQAPHMLRTVIAACLDLPEHRVRVITPDVGGGFGHKAFVSPEELTVCALARMLGVPVQWVEDRRENLTANLHAREQRLTLALAFAADGRLLGMRADILSDAGAYSVYPSGSALDALSAMLALPGPYAFPAFEATLRAALTNKAPTGSYRGVGMPIGTFAREVLLDAAARRLGIDPVDVRVRNLIPDGAFPYTAANGAVYDSGRYRDLVDRAMRAIDYEGLRRVHGGGSARVRAEDRHRGRTGEGAPDRHGAGSRMRWGVGIACFVEATAPGVDVYGRTGVQRVGGETAWLRMEPSGEVTAFVGTVSQGQGHETALAQVVAGTLGLPLEAVRVVAGDTLATPYGGGTIGSRTAVASGGALLLASRALRDRLTQIAAHLLEASPADIESDGGVLHVRGARERGLPVREVARVAHFETHRLPPEIERGLQVTEHHALRTTWSSAVHAAVVEVDAGVGAVRVERYVVVEDCGPIINPLIVDGQVHGGVAQGLGEALLEHAAYGADGQPLAATLQDYLLPTSADVPPVEVHHLETPSPHTVGEFKGMGESGTIGAPAAVVNAVADALGVEITRMPLRPEDLVIKYSRPG
ncbi:MAG: xanthine dehydrogenase family protein [Armatimonadetes bacterium]|nr:xanthine dehydrogenase family protein [Armatimonadota bacterium]